MKFNTEKLYKTGFLILAAYSIVSYIFAHAAYLLMSSDAGIVFEYITLYLGKISGFLIPTMIAAAVTVIYTYVNFESSLLFALVVSSARILYTLPYYYIVFIYNYSYDSVESIALAILASVLTVIFTALLSMALFGVAITMSKIALHKTKGSSVKDFLREKLLMTDRLDILGGANPQFLACVICMFVYNLIIEIVDTVLFFTEYGFDFSTAEIITIMANYVLILAMTVISYIAMTTLKNRLLKRLS